MAAPTESTFHVSVRHIFESWVALRLAVESGEGGIHSAEKARWMVDATEQWFNEDKNGDLEVYEVEEFLASVLDAEFNTLADDQSLQKVAEYICLSWSLIQKGRGDEAVQRMQALPKATTSHSKPLNTGDDESSDESDDETPPQLANSTPQGAAAMLPSQAAAGDANDQETPMEEDDGWTTVTKKPPKKR